MRIRTLIDIVVVLIIFAVVGYFIYITKTEGVVCMQNPCIYCAEKLDAQCRCDEPTKTSDVIFNATHYGMEEPVILERKHIGDINLSEFIHVNLS